jgi:hypothetical protein
MRGTGGCPIALTHIRAGAQDRWPFIGGVRRRLFEGILQPCPLIYLYPSSRSTVLNLRRLTRMWTSRLRGL